MIQVPHWSNAISIKNRDENFIWSLLAFKSRV